MKDFSIWYAKNSFVFICGRRLTRRRAQGHGGPGVGRAQGPVHGLGRRVIPPVAVVADVHCVRDQRIKEMGRQNAL
jgi:hypothetical protein